MALHNFIREAIFDLKFKKYNEKEDYLLNVEDSDVNSTVDEGEMGFICDIIARELMLG